MDGRGFCRKVAALLTVAVLLCGLVGCRERETVSSAPDGVSSAPQSVPDERAEAAQSVGTSSDNSVAGAPQSTPAEALNNSVQGSTPDWFSKCLEYDWVRSDGLMISSVSVSEYMSGPLFKISLCDLNLDGTPEVILSQKYSSRVPQVNDIYVIRDGGISYLCSFYGTADGQLSVYTDKNTGQRAFVCTDTVYMNSVESQTTILCRYSDDFTGFECVPLCSSHRDDVRSETRYRSEYDTGWIGFENENSPLLTADEYNAVIERFTEPLELLESVRFTTSSNAVHYKEGFDESWCTSEKELKELLIGLYSDHTDTAPLK